MFLREVTGRHVGGYIRRVYKEKVPILKIKLHQIIKYLPNLFQTQLKIRN